MGYKMSTQELFTAWKAGTLTYGMVERYYGETELRFISISPDGVSVCIAAGNGREFDYWEDVF